MIHNVPKLKLPEYDTLITKLTSYSITKVLEVGQEIYLKVFSKTTIIRIVRMYLSQTNSIVSLQDLPMIWEDLPALFIS